jgi:ADP-heptose:LPS heptosyltransferase
MENINHIQTAEIFIGGDTGTTHFAFSLDRGPKDLIYYNSSRGLIHTLPFYLLEGKGKMATYWMDFEGTKF